MQERFQLFRAGQCVLELGAAPGGWSQALVSILGKQGQLIAVDKLDMEPLNDVVFVRGDFRETEARQRIKSVLGKRKIDLVISDMSPNITGVRIIDDQAIVSLNDDTLQFAAQWANCHTCLMKSFQCEDLAERLRDWRTRFKQVRVIKPTASRSSSREQYLLISGINHTDIDSAYAI